MTVPGSRDPLPHGGLRQEQFAADVRTLIERHEGLRLKPYLDTRGKWTIGYGRNLSDDGIRESEAGVLLSNDVRAAQADLARYQWFSPLSPVRQAVVTDMVFQLGSNGFAGFRDTIAAIAAGRWNDAADAMLDSAWAREVPSRAQRLSQMMRTNTWPVR